MTTDYKRLDKDDAAVLLVDHQTGLLSLVRDLHPDTFKNNVLALADLAVSKLAPVSDEMKRLLNDPAEIDRTLEQGADKARAIAAPILDRTYEIVGFLSS
jgi:nicotinamidase-related amidase